MQQIQLYCALSTNKYSTSCLCRFLSFKGGIIETFSRFLLAWYFKIFECIPNSFLLIILFSWRQSVKRRCVTIKYGGGVGTTRNCLEHLRLCKSYTYFPVLFYFPFRSTCEKDDCNRLKRLMSGKYRKGCPCNNRGSAIQPDARVFTTFRLGQLRKLMVNETVTKGHHLDAYIIPSKDEHQVSCNSQLKN